VCSTVQKHQSWERSILSQCSGFKQLQIQGREIQGPIVNYDLLCVELLMIREYDVYRPSCVTVVCLFLSKKWKYAFSASYNKMMMEMSQCRGGGADWKLHKTSRGIMPNTVREFHSWNSVGTLDLSMYVCQQILSTANCRATTCRCDLHDAYIIYFPAHCVHVTNMSPRDNLVPARKIYCWHGYGIWQRQITRLTACFCYHQLLM